MTQEWGIFTPEGLLEGDFWSEESAGVQLNKDREAGGIEGADGYVARVCDMCREGEADHCPCQDDEGDDW